MVLCMEAIGEVSSTSSNVNRRPPTPLQFRRPRWYQLPEPPCPEGVCEHHVVVCDPVAITLLRIKSPPLLPQEFEVEVLRIQLESYKMQDKIHQIPVEDKIHQIPVEARKERKRKNRKTKKETKTDEEKFEEEKKRVEDGKKREEERKKFNENWTKMMQVPKWTIKEGERYNISELLSSPTRDYLINHAGHQVKIKDLSLPGKYVMLYFMYLPGNYTNKYNFDADVEEVYKVFIQPVDTRDSDEVDAMIKLDLHETYNIYNPKGEFEVVFVAIGKNKHAFLYSFSSLSGFAIPHNDEGARNLERKFNIPPEPMAPRTVLFDRDGTVLLDDASFTMISNGSQGFPYTNQKLNELDYKARALWDGFFENKDKPSLTKLLGEFVMSPNEVEVATSQLERKGTIVGLYFFELSTLGFKRTKELLDIWNSLNGNNKLTGNNKFEIVLIYKGCRHLKIAKDAFRKKFGYPIPWYTLASDGDRQLCEVFKFSYRRWRDCHLVVLEPDRYRSLSFFAFSIYEVFGIRAYPFTMEKAVELAKGEQQKELVLNKLLSPSAPLLSGGSTTDNKEMTTVSELLGKRVLLLFATQSCYESVPSMRSLEEKYRTKGADDQDFEIIYMSLDCCGESSFPTSFAKSIQEMPWLVHSFVPDFGLELVGRVFDVFPPELPAIAAFGPDGHLETKECDLALKSELDSNYPFIQADLGEAVHREVIHEYDWDVDANEEWVYID